MDTSPGSQLNKPTFGTSDFAVSAVDSREYIDATAEETCPAEFVPMPEPDTGPQRAADEAAEAPSAASLEVMDQLKALAHNVTQGTRASSGQDDASLVQSNMSEGADASDPGEPQAPEPSISVFPRPTGFEDNQVINNRPKSGSRVLILAGFAVAAVIGAGGTFAWQTHLTSNDAATAAAPAPVAPAPVVAPYVGRQLEELAEDISSLHHRMEELAAKQQQRGATAARSARGQATTTYSQARTGWPKHRKTPGAGAGPAKNAGSRTAPCSRCSTAALCSAAAGRTATARTANGGTSHTAAAHTATMTR